MTATFARGAFVTVAAIAILAVGGFTALIRPWSRPAPADEPRQTAASRR